jgi:hypothetical protein
MLANTRGNDTNGLRSQIFNKNLDEKFPEKHATNRMNYHEWFMKQNPAGVHRWVAPDKKGLKPKPPNEEKKEVVVGSTRSLVSEPKKEPEEEKVPDLNMKQAREEIIIQMRSDFKRIINANIIKSCAAFSGRH